MTKTQPAKPALLLMAHGSPKPESNASIYEIADELRRREKFADIEIGFMECNAPDIPAAIQNLVRRGASEIIAVPYFLHAGNHVANDLPDLLEAAEQQFPEVQFLMGDFLGRDELLSDVLRDRVEEAQ